MNNLNKLLVLAVLACGSARAAEPELKPAVVTDSQVYQRAGNSVSVAGFPVASSMVDVSRVTVTLDQMAITAQWEPKTSQSVTAQAFKPGTEVLAAIDRGKLLLKAPDGSVVNAKIARREKIRSE
jgi:hypothetical protein